MSGNGQDLLEHGIDLLHDAQHAVVEVFVKVLRAGEGDGASRAHPSDTTVQRPLVVAAVRRRRPLPRIRRRALDAMHGGQMPFEDVRAVEALLSPTTATTAGTEAADHGALVVRQGVAVLVVLAGETFGVVVAGRDGAFLGPFGLVG